VLYERAHRGELAAKDVADSVYLDPHCRRRGSGDPSQGRLEAARKLARLRGELGAVTFALLVAVAARDECWAEIGRRLHCDPKTARSWAVTALQALATL
jgi:hypothetical protein